MKYSTGRMKYMRTVFLTKRWFRIADSIAFLLLLLFFGGLYLSTYSFGMTNGDSSGYVINAARMYQGVSLVYQHPIVQEGLAFFENPEMAEWLAPRHSSVIHINGSIASKYPIGVSLLMVPFAWIGGSEYSMYLLSPVAGLFVLLLLFIVTRLILEKQRVHPYIATFFAFFSAGLLGVSEQFVKWTSQAPMRDIPSVVFLLGAIACFLWSERVKRSLNGWVVLLLGAGLFGFGVNIRHTLIVTAPFLLFLAWNPLKMHAGKTWTKKWFMLIGTCLLVAGVMLLPTVVNSLRIQMATDKSSLETVVGANTEEGGILERVFSNGDHLATLQWKNAYDNRGKHKIGEGSFFVYIGVLQENTYSWVVLTLIIIGIAATIVYVPTRWIGIGLLGSILGTVFLFSFWINPYDRYILPSIILLFIFSGIGGAYIVTMVNKKSVLGAVCIGCILLAWTVIDTSNSIEEAFFGYQKRFQQNTGTVLREDRDAFVRLEQELSATEKNVVFVATRHRRDMAELYETHIDGAYFITAPWVTKKNKKTLPSVQEITKFAGYLQSQGYTLYVLNDQKKNLDRVEGLLEEYQIKHIQSVPVSYEQAVHLYQLGEMLSTQEETEVGQ